jgi:hypothetical protein
MRACSTCCQLLRREEAELSEGNGDWLHVDAPGIYIAACMRPPRGGSSTAGH